jgi:hypothetical protein
MRRLLIASALLLASAGAASAQSLEDRLRSQLSATTAELRELKSAQAGLAADKAAAEKERDGLKAQLAAAKRKQAPAHPSQAELDAARAEQAAADQVRFDAAAAENQRLSQELAKLTADHQRTTAQANADAAALKVCRVKHAELTVTANDILAAYDHVSAAGLLVRHEPVTGLGRLPAQRRVQAYSDRLYAARLDVRPSPPPAATASPAH